MMKDTFITKQLDIFCKIITHILAVKSPHTAKHIHRVPVLSNMLAKAYNKKHKKFFSADDLYKIDIAAKLHDTGKITTPDYLLDKSTKLECLYNRIHEIRCRFEILRRDAEIAYLKKIIDNPKNTEIAQQEFKDYIKKLEQDFSFIAQCNTGETKLSSSDIKQIKRISRYKFKRHFNRLLGLSWIEKNTLSQEQIKKYQHQNFEYVLQDVSEDTAQKLSTSEIYNLDILKGTLNPLERQIVEQHVIETENILNLLKLPKNYQEIITYAAEHHERLNGEGYPLGLKEDKLSIASRIIMIADIFEALTSRDRPYKSPKKISETLHILQAMKNKGQIDADIYHLFLKDKIFITYAQKYLSPEQIDEISISDYL